MEDDMTIIEQNTQNEDTTPQAEKAFLDSGHVVLTAPTVEQLNAQITSIPTGVHYTVGAVQHNLAANNYSIRIDILNSEEYDS